MTKFDTLYKQTISESSTFDDASRSTEPVCINYKDSESIPFNKISRIAQSSGSVVLVSFGIDTFPPSLLDRAVKHFINPSQKELLELITSDKASKAKIVIIKPYDLPLSAAIADRCTMIHPNKF